LDAQRSQSDCLLWLCRSTGAVVLKAIQVAKMNTKLLWAGLAILGAVAGCDSISAAAGSYLPNIITNGSFEVPLHYNGTTLRYFSASDAAYLSSDFAPKTQRAWAPLPTQGWLAEGSDASGITIASGIAHMGTHSLQITGAPGVTRSAISSFETHVDAGPATLTAWVRTRGAKGSLSLDLVTGWQQVQQKAAVAHLTAPLPADTAGWTPITLTAQAPSRLAAVVRLTVHDGTVWLDDVELTASSKPVPFNVRPQEWIRLGLDGFDNASLPQVRAQSLYSVTLAVANDSREPLPGKAVVWLGPWNAPQKARVASFSPAALPPGSVKKLQVPIADLRPGGYVFTTTITGGAGIVVSSAEDFYPLEPAGGGVSNGTVSSQDVLRLATIQPSAPQKLFGVQNGMLQADGGWWGGYNPKSCIDAGLLGVRCSRGHYSDDVGYMTAMGGMDFHATFFDDPRFGSIDSVTDGSNRDGLNPAFPQYLDLSSAAGRARLTESARNLGKWLASRPVIASYEMANEAPYLNDGHLCPSASADADFRNWCHERYKTLGDANRLWKTHYSSWGQVEQIVSAKFIDQVKAEPQKTGAAAIDWAGASGRLDDAVVKRMNESPGLAMDWLRWRTAVTLRSYQAFHDTAKKYSPRTLISTNLCWPAFFPQTTLPFFRGMDVNMVDIDYTAGLPRTLGTPYEMMDSMEMAETCAPNKPVWGIETYYQPQLPPEFMALQNWGLLAHGMSNNLVFAWMPYSDAGAVKGSRAWEKPGAPPMWLIIDNDGTKLPGYYTYKRSLDEIRSYNQRYNGLSVKRAPTDTAFYVSLDTAQYVIMQTGDKPWMSPWQQTRNNLAYLLRMQGVSFDYVDDATIPDAPGKYRRIVVPASRVLSQTAASRLGDFARRGGVVILAGMSGICDPWLNTYANVGGPEWAGLHWTAPGFSEDFRPVSFVATQSAEDSQGTVGSGAAVPEDKQFRGVGLGNMPGAAPIRDADGTLVGWQRSWGKGRLVAYGIFPDTYVPDPHAPANMLAWVKQLIALGRLPIAGRWIADGPDQPGLPGEGSPVVEVVVRQRSVHDRFVFVLNQGGAGSGTVEVPLGPGAWTAADVITGKPLQGAITRKGVFQMHRTLPPFGYIVVHLTMPGSGPIK
jgi:hypothetical protein